VGCYGDRAAETPALDRLAREGVRFAWASSSVPLTLPSHSTILSGLLPPHHGLRNNGAGRFPAGTATLATTLAAAGYRTGAFVGAFVLDHRFGLSRGFEVYDDEVARDASGGVPDDAERRGDVVVDRALAWLRAPHAPRPFFLWVHFYDAHAPYDPPSPYRERHAGRPYDGEIAFADAQLGRLLAALDEAGLAGRTIVAAAADHGEALGEHGELTHGLLLYEPTLRVPLLLRAPGRLAPRTVAAAVSLADLAPTVAALAGHPLPAPAGGRLDGRDLSAALSAGAEPPPADLYAETRYPALFGWSPLQALTRRGQKYIRAPRPELYDLARDPGETADLAKTRDARGFAARLAEIEAGAEVAPPAALNAEERARLESLGYAAPSGGAAASAAGAADHGADPKDRAPLFRRYEEAVARLRSGDSAPALAALAELVAADPGNPVFRGKLAQGYRERGELGRAVPLYRQAAEAAPRDPEAWYNLGVAAQEAGDVAESRRALAQAVALDPARPEAHNALGIAALAAGDAEAARGEIERAVALDPANARALNNLGNVLRAERRFDAAEGAYRRAAAAAPRYADPWNGLGTLAVERDRPGDAIPLFDRALALAPGYHEVLLNRAIAYEQSGDARAAGRSYREFLAATADAPQFAAQRRAAEQLLARLSSRPPDERR
jgi:arylsulfatase A-like enzyme/Tfp pilus assembly protein PilF